MQKKNRVNILGVPVDMVDKEQASAVFAEIFQQPGCSMIVTPNSEIVQNASKDEELRSLIASADLIIPDGIGLVYASKVMGCPLSERVTGIDFLESIIARLAQTGESIFFFGSKPGVADEAADRMKKKYPGLRVAGTQNVNHLCHLRTGYSTVRLERAIFKALYNTQRYQSVHNISVNLNVGLIRERCTSKHGECASKRQYQCENLFEILHRGIPPYKIFRVFTRRLVYYHSQTQGSSAVHHP